MSQTRHAPILILGSGTAGLTAGIYAARALCQPVLLQGIEPGGQLTITTDVENYPGFADVIQGPWLMEQMEKQARNVGVELIADVAVKAELAQTPFRITTDGGTLWTCDSLIIATGAQAKWLGLPSEEKFKGFGVSACATCDGFFYRDKKVIVVGGGNTAAEEALFLTKFASEVFLVHRRDKMRAEALLQKRVADHPKIKPVWNSEISKIIGQNDPLSVSGAMIRSSKTGDLSQINAEGVFIAIGHQPQTQIFQNQIKMKDDGTIITKPHSTLTSRPGIFAAGDVADDVFRQAITAAGMGCMAALEADAFLKSN